MLACRIFTVEGLVGLILVEQLFPSLVAILNMETTLDMKGFICADTAVARLAVIAGEDTIARTSVVVLEGPPFGLS